MVSAQVARRRWAPRTGFALGAGRRSLGNRRVQRGGGLDDVTELRSTNRSGVSPSYDLGFDTGFRIVLGRASP